MAEKRLRTKIINIETRDSGFSAIFKRFRSEKSKETSELSMLKSILSPEKARILHILRTKQPNSIYEITKLLGRNFKAVRQDISLLERAGLIEMIPIHKGNRTKLKPILVVDKLEINIEL